MNISRKQTDFPKSIISNLSNAFSLTETIMAVSISVFLIALIVGITFMLYSGFKKLNDNALKLYNISGLVELVSGDVLNPDIFPRHPLKPVQDQSSDIYKFGKDEITFFASGGKTEYGFTDVSDDKKVFSIRKNGRTYKFPFVKEFSIDYYDDKDFLFTDFDSYPYYCIMNFIFYDKKKSSVRMRL